MKFCILKGNLPYHIVLIDRSHGALKLAHDVINALQSHAHHTHSPRRPGVYVRTHTHARMQKHTHTHTKIQTHINTYYIVPQYSIIKHHISITVQCSTVYYEVIISQGTTVDPVAEWIRHWSLEPGIGMRIRS